MLPDVFRNIANAFRCCQCPLPVDVPYFLIAYVFLFLHGADVINSERQYIPVGNGIYNGVSMKFGAKGLLGCA